MWVFEAISDSLNWTHIWMGFGWRNASVELVTLAVFCWCWSDSFRRLFFLRRVVVVTHLSPVSSDGERKFISVRKTHPSNLSAETLISTSSSYTLTPSLLSFSSPFILFPLLGPPISFVFPFYFWFLSFELIFFFTIPFHFLTCISFSLLFMSFLFLSFPFLSF